MHQMAISMNGYDTIHYNFGFFIKVHFSNNTSRLHLASAISPFYVDFYKFHLSIDSFFLF